MRKTPFVCLLIICLCSAFVFQCKCAEEKEPGNGEQREKQPDISGIYLMGTGFGSLDLICLNIQQNQKGKLTVERVPRPTGQEWKAESQNHRLVLTEGPTSESIRQNIYSVQFSCTSEFIPSKTTPGDWDLAHLTYGSFQTGKNAGSENKKETDDAFDPPVDSYLHRHPDKRVADFFRSPYPSFRTKGNQDQKISRRYEIASALVADHPEDLYSRLFYMEALVWRKEWTTLAAQIREWEPRFAESNLAQLFQLVKHNLRAHDLSAAGRNAADLLNTIYDPPCDLATLYQRFPDVLNYTELAYYHLSPYDSPNFLAFQVSAKVLCMGATFLMLEGRREDALCILCALYHESQLWSQNGSLIQRLVGVAVRNIASTGLEMFALNCCEDPAECEHAWLSLEQLQQWEKAETLEDPLHFEGPGAPHLRTVFRKMITVKRNEEEAITRARYAQSRFQLVRAALAARHCLLRSGVFPRKPEDFAPLLAEGPPQDPHHPETPLRFRQEGDQFLCYSEGPDQQDDQGTIPYDPTNGSRSQGDIVLRIPRERKYPLPREGVRASNRSDLLRQFPNGLPPDLFASTMGKPLEATDTMPVYVYSYGPDRDEHGDYCPPSSSQWPDRRKREPIDFPEISYDPTNGATSGGDLFLIIPPR